jgi:hypothetical protein
MNTTPKRCGWPKGVPHSPEHIEKRIAPLRGRPRPPEVRAKISATKRARTGASPSA